MIHSFRRYNCVIIIAQTKTFVKETNAMTLLQKRLLILLVVALAAALLGRLAVRAVLNLLLGGTLFGGNFL